MSGFSAFWSSFRPKNDSSLPRIGFTDFDDSRITTAVKKIAELEIAEPVLVGGKKMSEKELEKYSQILLAHSKKGELDSSGFRILLNKPFYQGISQLLAGEIDGLIGGANQPTAEIVKGALAFIRPKEGYRLIAGHFLIESQTLKSKDETPFLFADCAVIPDPSPRALASVAAGAAESFKFFTGKIPKIAFLSFSTRGSAAHPLVDKVKEGMNLLKKQDPALFIDGELQVDAALDREVASRKNAGGSPVAGEANVFIFPSLEAGNIGYKLVQRFSETRVAGPILWGLGKPVSDLSRGCSVQEVVDTAICVAKMTERIN